MTKQKNSDLEILESAQTIVPLLYGLSDLESAQGNLLDSAYDATGESPIIDFDDIIKHIINLLKNEDNRKLACFLSKNYPDLANTKFLSFTKVPTNSGDTLTNHNVDNNMLSEIESPNDSSTTKQSDNNKILGSWLLNESSANEAKYLIGISSIDKRILATYALDNSGYVTSINGRVDFTNVATPINDLDASGYGPMPKLEKWNAQNPVLYYKQFLEKKNLDLDDTEKIIVDILDLSSPYEFDELTSKDIIVVRTQRLG